METTTHSTSEGDVLPATDPDDDFEKLFGEDADAPRTALTFEQRTIRTLLSFERKRLAMQQAELAMETERFTLHRAHVIAERTHRSALFDSLAELVTTHLPGILPLLLERLGLDDVPEAPAPANEPGVRARRTEAARPKAESPRAAVG